MKRLLLSLLMLLALSSYTKEQDKPLDKLYQVGRFTIKETTQGYIALTGDTISLTYKTAYKAIESIR